MHYYARYIVPKHVVGPGTNTTFDDANKFRDCSGRCKLDSDYATEFIVRTDCNGTVCAPRNLDMKACDAQCYFPSKSLHVAKTQYIYSYPCLMVVQNDQKPNPMCSGGSYPQGYCLKPTEVMPATIMDDCGTCFGNGSSCRDCTKTRGG